MKKRILFIATLVLTVFFSFTAYAGTWQQEGSNWKYLKDDGAFASREWVQDSGRWYYFNEQGFMLANQWVDGICYLGTDGAMLVNTTTPDGYIVGADGKWNGLQSTAKTENSTAVTTRSASAVASEVSYIGNANTMKFHRRGCASIDKMAEYNKVEIKSRDEAINKGYVPCKNCNP